MNQQTIDNWKKIKAALETAGKTDCDYYRRACEVVIKEKNLSTK
jgi:hypothetical protein